MRINTLSNLLLLLVLVTLVGCSTVQNAWYDFNAYFNTYYNAQNYYEEGLRQVENREIEYNPERPIRIHPSPEQVGQSDFEEASLKAAEIVHNHENSRWVDNAIELIGKAYFYQQDFFGAGQNFDEIYNNAIDETRRQNAVLWRSKVFMEMEEYSPGISYVTNHLYSDEFEWDSDIKAELQLVFAQLYTYTEQWENAEEYLREGIEEVSDRQKEYRAWFLLGQVQERMENWEDAWESYAEATSSRNEDFNLIFQAYMKKGEMMRNLGEYQMAYDHFFDMSRDDNFYEYLGDIEYQKARTLHLAGEVDEAVDQYKLTLRQEVNPPSQKYTALIYYGLAEIHRDIKLDYTLAAAYFDSSRTSTPSSEVMPENFDAELMAESYGEYAELKSTQARLDSLLWLGSLDDEEFDAVVEEVRQSKIEELREEMKEQERGPDMVVQQDDMEETDEMEAGDENGFLNHLNRERMTRASQQFNAYWGNRPLVDDWRRGEAVRLAIREREVDEDVEEDDVVLDPQDTEDEEAIAQQVTVDISEVPFDQEEKEEMQRRLASTAYEIGNVFFLSLDMPDSAAANYEGVIENYPESDLVSQSLYSLTEVYSSMGDTAKAREYAERLVADHPSTLFAQRISERMDIALPEVYQDIKEDTSEVRWRELEAKVDEEFSSGNVDELRRFASRYPDSDKAPIALYHATMGYIQKAKDDTNFTGNLKKRDEKKAEWQEEEKYISTMRDSAQALLEADTTLSDEDQQYWQAWADTTISEPDFSEYDPYQNAYWDSARVMVAKISEEYQDFPLNSRLSEIQNEIGAPPEPETDEEAETEGEEVDQDYVECDQLDEEPEILGGLDSFLERSGFQETIDQMMLTGEFDVTAVIDEEGYVVDVIYTEDEDPLGFMDELSEAMLEEMNLSPPLLDGDSVKAKCVLNLQLDYN